MKMSFPLKRVICCLCICAAVLFSGYAAPRKEEPATLMVYAGAGLKKPMEKIKEQFEKEHSIQLTMVYAGSGQLLAQLAKSGKGDVFIVGSKPTYDAAVEKGLAGKGVPVSHHTPVIITSKDNPKKISGLKDLAQDGLRLALGDEKANAIGKTSVKMFEKAAVSDYEKNVVVKTATVNELYQAIKSGSADACIVTKDSAFGKDDLALIEIEPEFLIDQIITAGSLTISNNPDKADAFVHFLTEDFAIKAFETFGFKPVAKSHE
ncbi:MAG: molybdate ABC transporter substrate-binding protein [Treponema sp.]